MQADLPATALPLLDPVERRAVLTRILDKLAQIAAGEQDLAAWAADRPLVEVTFR